MDAGNSFPFIGILDEHTIPSDRGPYIWFDNPDIAHYTEAVLAIYDTSGHSKRTRSKTKLDGTASEAARQVLEGVLLNDSSGLWVMRLTSFSIHVLGFRVSIESAAELYTNCLHLAMTEVAQINATSLDRSAFKTAFSGPNTRKYIHLQRKKLESDYAIECQHKISLTSPSDDNDAVQDQLSALETEDLDDECSEGSATELDLSTLALIEAFELTDDNRLAFLDLLAKSPHVQLLLCQFWLRVLEDYFSQCLSAVSEQKLELLRVRALRVFSQMKNAPRRKTRLSEPWQLAIARSGLAVFLNKVIRSDFMLDWQTQARTASHGALQHDSWTPRSELKKLSADDIAAASTYPTLQLSAQLIDLGKYGPDVSPWLRRLVDKLNGPKRKAYDNNNRAKLANDPTYKAAPFNDQMPLSLGVRLLGFFGDNEDLLPTRFNMHAYFFLLDLPHFLRNFSQWIRAGLYLRGYSVEDSRIADMYAELMAVKKDDLVCEKGSRLNELFRESVRLRAMFKKTSPVGVDKLQSKSGVKVWLVDELSGPAYDLAKNAALTFHLDDPVQPKANFSSNPTSKRRKSSNSKPGRVFLSPDDSRLGLRPVSRQPQVVEKHKRDIHVFIERKTRKIVGGVIFEALKKNQLRRSQANHSLVSKAPNVRRGASFVDFGHGKMVPKASRVAAGGVPGDEYRPYQSMVEQAEKSEALGDNDDMRMMFAHAEDAENMFNAVRQIVPEVVDEIRKISDESGLKSMGSSGVSTYYCTNYLAPQHEDKDVGWSLCSQLFKNIESAGGVPDDFGFAFTKWGLYIVTEENCVWWFRSGDLHGTIMPSNTTLERLQSLAKEERRQTAQKVRAVQRLRGGAGSDNDEDDGASDVATAGSTPPRTTGSGGIHVTIRKKDEGRARRYAETQERAGARRVYWERRTSEVETQ